MLVCQSSLQYQFHTKDNRVGNDNTKERSNQGRRGKEGERKGNGKGKQEENK